MDSPLQGLEAYESAPIKEIRSATRRAFENMIKLCMEEEVNFLIISGDLYDGDWKDFNTGLFFIQQMSLLRERGIQVFIVHGNHDAQSRITKRLRLPDNVTQLRTLNPETILMEDIKVAIHGQSFLKAAELKNLAKNYPKPANGYFNIGILHTSVNGREGHENYAPCSQEELAIKGYDYWALGHIHKREVLNENPYILFPGCLQGRHIKETGPKGCTILELRDGKLLSAEHRAVDVLRWQNITIDANQTSNLDELLDLVEKTIHEEIEKAEERFLAIRFNLEGNCKNDEAITQNPELVKQQIRGRAADIGAGVVWVEKVNISTRYLNEASLIGSEDALDELNSVFTSLIEDPAAIAEIQSEFSTLLSKLPPEIKETDDGIKPNNSDWMEKLIHDAMNLSVSKFKA